jgi:protein-L-isoaspartate(D-aspartate) O-methyltransferase
VIPQPLVDQLADGGRMLVPVGPKEEQVLKLVTKRGSTLEAVDVAPVRFVPLYGMHGWEQT